MNKLQKKYLKKYSEIKEFENQLEKEFKEFIIEELVKLKLHLYLDEKNKDKLFDMIRNFIKKEKENQNPKKHKQDEENIVSNENIDMELNDECNYTETNN